MKFKNLLTAYLLILTVECFANGFGVFWLQCFSKPSLVLVLLIYFVHESKDLGSVGRWIAGALVFSWLGDILLLIEKRHEFLFIYGLLAFLVAHICYVAYFLKVGKLNRSNYSVRPIPLLTTLAYSLIFYFYLFPALSEMKIPVLIYTTVISGMLIAGFHAFDNKGAFARICLAGIVLFVLSDSILALNRFVFAVPLGSVFVMITYALGQLLITEGSLRNLKHLKLR